MRFSVIIPLYNKEKYISRCLRSVLRQTERNFEVIVVDDGSTDASVNIVKSYANEKITLLHQENQGPGSARNVGVRHAGGEWVAFIDADDAWVCNHLAELNRIVEGCSDAVFVSTTLRECSNSSSVDLRAPLLGEFSEQDFFAIAANSMGAINPSCVAINRSVFNEFGGFKNWYTNEDHDLWCRLSLRHVLVRSTANTAIYYRGTGGLMDNSLAKLSNKSSQQVESLRELNPVVGMLFQELQRRDRCVASRDSIVRYINARVTLAARSSFYNGQVARAKSISFLYVRPLSAKALRWKRFLSLPRIFLLPASAARVKARSMYRLIGGLS